MRVFWYNGALQVVPESDRETTLLCELTNNITIGKPPETQNRISSGDTALGSESLFETVAGNEEARPSSLTGKTNNKQLVVCINKLL
jgi:hypothetical protein